MLEILAFILGPAATNAYLAADARTKQAVVVDPAWDGGVILDEAGKRGWQIGQLWYTHAHFDHFGGAAELARGLLPPPVVALHAADRPLWERGGDGPAFGYDLDPGPVPSLDLARVRLLRLGPFSFQVRHAPGHTPGLCIFYCAEAGLLFSGDLIFHRSVGRIDLPGGDEAALLASIREQVYTLPESTRILPGHGQETSVGQERRENPFIRP